MKAAELFEELKRGEVVTILHSPMANVYEPFNAILRYALSSGIPILVVDMGDMLHVYKTNMEFFGEDSSLVDRVKVIKIGGSVDIGKIEGRIEWEEDAAIVISKYNRLLKETLEKMGFAIKIVLGLDKLIAFYSSNRLEVERIISYLRLAAGDERVIAFYFMNRGILEDVPQALYCMGEESTTLLEAGDIIRVVKSPNFEIIGKEVTFTHSGA